MKIRKENARIPRMAVLLMAPLLLLTGCGTGAAEQPGSATGNATENAAESASAPAAESSAQSREEAATESQAQEPDDVSSGSASLSAQAEAEDASAPASDVLVVYFSRTGEQYTVGEIDKGNTAIVAEMIAEETGADLYEVLPEEDYYPYTYNELTDMAKQEQNEGARPAYQKNVPDLAQYSAVFIGAPVWWGDWPMIMYTFFENENLSGKTLIPFSTHEGSGLSGFDQKLSVAIPDATVLAGLAIRGNDAQNNRDGARTSIREWLDGLSY